MCPHRTQAVNSAGELNSDELERLVTIIQNPLQFKIPSWFLNRQKDIVDGKHGQILSNGVDSKLRDDLERLKKIRAHRGLRHYWGLRVRGQHTKTTGAFYAAVLWIQILMRFRPSRQDRRCVQEEVNSGRRILLSFATGRVMYVIRSMRHANMLACISLFFLEIHCVRHVRKISRLQMGMTFFMVTCVEIRMFALDPGERVSFLLLPPTSAYNAP